ncbi:AAR2 domain-containing protein [Trichoderma compactum]
MSYDSVQVLGAHPLGSLRVVHPDESMDVEEGQDSPPPPLDPPENLNGRKRVQFGDARTEMRGDSSSLSNRLSISHSMGGGDVLLILDLPEVCLVGYDATSFTARYFGGIRDIPPGPHFFWVTHPDSGAVRTGFWIVSSGAHRVHVLQWDKFSETILEPSRAEARIQAGNLDTFHDKLVPYGNPSSVKEGERLYATVHRAAAERLQIWELLSGSVTEQVLGRVTGQHANTWHVDTTDRVKGAVLLAAEMELEKRFANHVFQSRELNFSFSQHSKTYSADVLGAARSLAATDATSYMMSVMSEPHKQLSEDDVVGELQFAFIVGVALGNDACIQQWRHMMVKLILKAYLLPEQRPVFAVKLLQTIIAQLQYSSLWLEESIMDYGGPESQALRLALIIYKRRLDEVLNSLGTHATPEQRRVGLAIARLETQVVALGWDLHADYVRRGKVMLEDGEEVEVEMEELQAEDERGEWAPEVVELDEHGRQRDLVSLND